MLARKMLLSGGGGLSGHYVTEFTVENASGRVKGLAWDTVNDTQLVICTEGVNGVCVIAPFASGELNESPANANISVVNADGVAYYAGGNLYAGGYKNTTFGSLFSQTDAGGNNLGGIGAKKSGEAIYSEFLVGDGAGNFYLSASRSDSSARNYIIACDAAGILNWEIELQGSHDWLLSTAVKSAAFDGTYLYAVFYERDISANNYPHAFIVKIDPTTPSIVWQRKLTTPSYGFSAAVISVDGAGNAYLGAYEENVGYFVVAKYNAAGVIQWKKTFKYGSYYSTYADIAVDETTGRLFLMLGSNQRHFFFISELDVSNGSILYTKMINGGSGNIQTLPQLYAHDGQLMTAFTRAVTGYPGYLINISADDNGDDLGTAANITINSVSTATLTTSNFGGTDSVGTLLFSTVSTGATSHVMNNQIFNGYDIVANVTGKELL